MPDAARKADLAHHKSVVDDVLADRGLGMAFVDAVEALMLSKATAALSREQTVTKGRTYRDAVEGLPEWAVCQACREAIRTTGDFPENPGQIRARTEAILAALRQRQAECAHVLASVPETDPDPAMRERIAAHMAELKMDLMARAAARNPAAPATPTETPEQALDRLKALECAGLELSPQALAAMGITRQQEVAD